jgi:DNA-binding NtrC family response regulator
MVSERPQTILVVEDDPGVRRVLERLLQREGYQVTAVESGEEALDALGHAAPDAACVDVDLPGMSGIQALEKMLARNPHLPVLMLTGQSAVENVVRAMRLGAYDYLTKPYDTERLLKTVRNAVEVRRAPQSMAPPAASARAMLGESAAIEAVYRQIDRVASTDVTVLVHGETGTGKELASRAIHDASARAGGPFIALSCAAIPESLQEAEFFGHEKGAFTHALSMRKGRFELAHRGTLFLDEVGELGLALQAKLLRVIQEKSFHRIGGTHEIASDFRLITATNRDLAHEVAQGRFRGDLYFRLAVFELELPALRERGDDLMLIARAFARRGGKDVKFHRSAEEAMKRYAWPGNVRELENTIQRALVMCRNDEITVQDLPPRVTESGAAAAVSEPVSEAPSRPRSMHDAERIALEQALAESDGNVSEAVRKLGIGRTTAYRLMKKHGIRS